MAGHSLDCGRIKQFTIVSEAGGNAFRPIVELNVHVDFRSIGAVFKAGRLPARSETGNSGYEGKQHSKKRIAAWIAVRLEISSQTIEWHVLVPRVVLQGIPHALQQFIKARIAYYGGANWRRLGKKPDQTFGSLYMPA